MLNNIVATIQTIQDRINHSAVVSMRVDSFGGLIVRAEWVCSKDRVPYFYQQVFSYGEIMNSRKGKDLIDGFVERTNMGIREAYLRSS